MSTKSVTYGVQSGWQIHRVQRQQRDFVVGVQDGQTLEDIDWI